MRGMLSAEVSIRTVATADLMPSEAQDLLAEAGSWFAGPDWWDIVLSDAMPAGETAIFVLVMTGAKVLAMVPMRRQDATGRLQSLTTPYTCRYTPLFAIGLDRETRTRAMAAFGRFCRTSGVSRLEAMPADWDGWPDLLAGARRARLRTLQFNHFGNWHEDVAGVDWAGYLSRRIGALRETIRRRMRRADKMANAHFALLTRPADMTSAAAAFESVYARSWKQPEPYPHFNVALMRAASARGLLRLGVWSIDHVPVAAQLWIQEAGHATVLKLAHDEAFKAYSPGTILTALMLRHLLDEEHVRQLDFGRGDDDYKQGWVTQRRQRIGLLLVNPWRPDGVTELVRHAAGRLRATIRRDFISQQRS